MKIMPSGIYNTVAQKGVPKTESDKKLLEAAKQFETIFVNQMLTQMRSTIPKDGLFEESTGEDIFKGMLDEEYSKQMSNAGGVGLAQIIYQQLSSKTNKSD